MLTGFNEVPPKFLILCEESGMPQTYNLCFFAQPMNIKQLADRRFLQIDSCLKFPHLHPKLLKTSEREKTSSQFIAKAEARGS